jgi:predicted AlkP superfamily pyrophosphatase or phosphodiesterase
MVNMPIDRSISRLSICLRNTAFRRCVLPGLIAICPLLFLQHASGAEPGHPREVVVNGKTYHWPRVPIVVIVIDGGDPSYVNAALEVGLLPNFKKLMAEGFVSVAQSVMPSFTNPNNISIITGVFPEVHGISGNFFLNPANGESEMMLFCDCVLY